MEKWNNSAIRQQIEEVITESYLRCLTEGEIREYLKRFLASCDHAIKDKPGGTADARLTGIKVALLRGYFLLNGDERPVSNPAPGRQTKQSGRKLDRERFAEQVVSTRSAILRLLDDYNPKISRMVIRKARGRCGWRRFLFSGTFGRTALLYAGYAVLFALTLFTIWGVLFH